MGRYIKYIEVQEDDFQPTSYCVKSMETIIEMMVESRKLFRDHAEIIASWPFGASRDDGRKST
jgi:hypothetical protein